MPQVPYLVSVPDPYDYISPHHVWPTTVLTPERIAKVLRVSGLRDLRVMRNSSGRTEAVRALTSHGWRQFSGQAIRTKFDLGSTDFAIHALTLDELRGRLVYGNHVVVQGWVRGLGKARLQQLTTRGWQTVRHIHPAPSGKFVLTLRATRSTELRLAYNGVAGDSVPMQVSPRVSLTAKGPELHAAVAPRLLLQVQRLTRRRWRPVASSRGVFNGALRPGSYRVAVLGGSAYAAAVSPAVSVRAK
jgi:hypothetical protein